jgi:hypothetical protein
MVGPLGGDAKNPGVPTINARNVDGGSPGRQCWRSGGAHHQHMKHQCWAPWEVMTEI